MILLRDDASALLECATQSRAETAFEFADGSHPRREYCLMKGLDSAFLVGWGVFRVALG
jgi:hypothetical protein